MDCGPPGFSALPESPGKNTGVDCLALLQRIFLTQGSNPRLLSPALQALFTTEPPGNCLFGGKPLNQPNELKMLLEGFPGGPVIKTLVLHCQVSSSSPGQEAKDPTSLMEKSKKRKKMLQ